MKDNINLSEFSLDLKSCDSIISICNNDLNISGTNLNTTNNTNNQKPQSSIKCFGQKLNNLSSKIFLK